MSAADPDQDDDVYASDEYEPESPTHSQPPLPRPEEPPSPPSVAPEQQTFQFDADGLDDEESEAGAVMPLPKTKFQRSRASDTARGRHLLDNTPWTYSVSALQVRMLRIPVVDSAAIRELRVFATIDKKAVQSRGSRWRHKLQSVGGASPLRSSRKRGKRGRSSGVDRRSGLIEEAKWMRGDGKLQWTFPMEKFRRLKAYAPRIKAFVYGIGELGVGENLAHEETEGGVVSFGWFFLDLRTPDLPERWLKLQNSPFGGEILISSAFSPIKLPSALSTKKSVARFEENASTNVRSQTATVTVNKAETMPNVVSGENGEYLQIGESGQDVFVLSVFIQSAFNLLKVVETSMGENYQELEQTGFWLSYSLFDVVVQTDVFYKLDVAEFSPIRDSFRVKSSLKDLSLCLEALGSLTVFMCTENRVLAGVEIALQPLLSNGLFAVSTKRENQPKPGDTSDIEGTFSFPDFDDAVISASVAVELVESKVSKTNNIQRGMSSDWVTVKDKGEVEALSFYCMFDLSKDPLQLKQEMQESVNIDLVSSDEERVGSSVFSLSYLYFSEEHFCCAEADCEEVFVTQAETEAHWLEVHTESSLPGTEAGPEAYSHSYRSCSISIPIVSTDTSNGSAVQQPRRVGSIRVSAYLEDTGLLTEKRAATQRPVLSFHSPLHDKVRVKDEAPAEARVVEAASVRTARERLNTASILREAAETSRYTSATIGPSAVGLSADNSHPSMKEENLTRSFEREKEAARFKENLERDRRAWKQEQNLQQLQWKRRFAEMEKARMDELEEEWARREEERSNLLKSAQGEYQRLEQTLRNSLADLETRERRLAVAEAALQREQGVKRDESESLQRRLKSEQHHTLSLAKKQTEAYERRIALLESQLNDAEQRAKQVETDFAEYRQQQRKLPESRLREEIAALKGNVSELEKQKMVIERECEMAKANVEKMKAQLEQMAGLLTQEKKKQEARVVDELEKLRVKYIAREERYVLDGDRDELRAIKKQLDDLKGFKLRGDGGKRRSYRQRSLESTSPQHHHNLWHTQNRQTAFVHHARSSSQHYQHPASSCHCDHASEDGSDWNAPSYAEATSYPATTTPQLNPHESRSEPEFSSSRSRTVHHHQDSLEPENVDIAQHDLGDSGGSGDSYVGSPGTELGRLLRERKLLLASGAYDAQSYLVRELDRLISVTKANTEHQRSVS
ncbi:hypothetical protein PHYPSEUDO_012075 [Phytophthora pseudosyringae]|uniref:C2H2-type domain-containing protein n=1 Tax=Phytophthora pseudosyringae TaxID=221518 RepID=A0A8T1VA45_9STRA|nr:hypothetical protein PHYPSEUDO_012075 [Phytophthora pseudosyringae]